MARSRRGGRPRVVRSGHSGVGLRQLRESPVGGSDRSRGGDGDVNTWVATVSTFQSGCHGLSTVLRFSDSIFMSHSFMYISTETWL